MDIKALFSKVEIKIENEMWFSYYCKLIEQCALKNKNRTVDYKEKHHIVPRCLFSEKQKADFSENYINLTPREHWVAHLLLYKSFPSHKKLSAAAVLLGSLRGTNLNSRTYESLVLSWRQLASDFMKEEMKRRKYNDPLFFEKLKIRSSQLFEQRPELKERISDSVKLLWTNQVYRDFMTKKIQESHKDPAYREKARENSLELYRQHPELKLKLSERNKSLWENSDYKSRQIQSHQLSWKDSEKRERMQTAIQKSWENLDLRKRHSSVIKAAQKKPEIRIKYIKNNYLVQIERSLTKDPENKQLLKKKDFWLSELARLTKEVNYGY